LIQLARMGKESGPYQPNLFSEDMGNPEKQNQQKSGGDLEMGQPTRNKSEDIIASTKRLIERMKQRQNSDKEPTKLKRLNYEVSSEPVVPHEEISAGRIRKLYEMAKDRETEVPHLGKLAILSYPDIKIGYWDKLNPHSEELVFIEFKPTPEEWESFAPFRRKAVDKDANPYYQIMEIINKYYETPKLVKEPDNTPTAERYVSSKKPRRPLFGKRGEDTTNSKQIDKDDEDGEFYWQRDNF
jgi:hypothetical protein